MKSWKVVIGLLLLALLAAATGPAGAGIIVEVPIDIVSAQDPYPLNVSQPGPLPVAVYTDQADWSTVKLQGVAPLEMDAKQGYMVLKFDAAAVIATLGPVRDRSLAGLTMTGVLTDGDVFQGHETVLVLNRCNQ